MEFTKKELEILLFLARTRLRYEAKRPVRLNQESGKDMQAYKVWELVDLVDKLEDIKEHHGSI